MTLPNRPVPTKVTGDDTFIYVKATSGSTFTLLAQISDATSSQEESMDKWRTIGSGVQTASNETKYPVSMTVRSPQAAIDELALIMGVVKPGGGWLGTEKIKIDPTRDIQIKFVNYNRATAAISHTDLWTNVNWDKSEDKTVGNGYEQWTFNGMADLVDTAPAAG